MRAMKFRVHNEEYSKAIQKRLFELGYGWVFEGEKKFIDKLFLFAESDSTISYVNTDQEAFFNDDNSKETTLDELYKLQSTKKIQLNKDHTAEILEKERVVKVGCQEFTFEKIEELHKAISTL